MPNGKYGECGNLCEGVEVRGMHDSACTLTLYCYALGFKVLISPLIQGEIRDGCWSHKLVWGVCE